MNILNRSRSDRCIDGSVACEYELSKPVDDLFLRILKESGTVKIKKIGSLIMFTCEKDQMKFKGMTGDSLILGSVQKKDLDSADIFMEDVIRLFKHWKQDLKRGV